MSVWALVVAAGSGARMGLGHNKALAALGGMTILERSVRAFAGLADGIVVVARAEDLDAVRALPLCGARITQGGATRQRSVLHGLRALPEDADIVLVHDAARPFVTEDIIRRCIDSAAVHGSGVASVPVKDTVKHVDASGMVVSTPPRASLRAAQTPQAFRVETLRQAIERLEAEGATATDDAAAVEAAGGSVLLVDGSEDNIKLTTPEDLRMAERKIACNRAAFPRTGHGYDAHRLVAGRALVLCGVAVPSEKGLLGHSDADVALHALSDALLGAAALGDIGKHFPDGDPAYKGISSLLLLEQVAALLRSHGYRAVHVDVTIVAERPKLRPYIARMAETVALALGIPADCTSIKATTTEGMGFEGEGLGISAHAVATIAAW